MQIRLAGDADAPMLQEIELLAGEQFRTVGLDVVADDGAFSDDDLAAFAADDRSWVALADDGTAMGYILAMVVDGNAHIEQVSVAPAYQGRGVGRALIERVTEWTQRRGMDAITLTTYTDVPWNAPLYAHLGFEVLREDQIGPELRALRAVEAEDALDPAIRVCMRLSLDR